MRAHLEGGGVTDSSQRRNSAATLACRRARVLAFAVSIAGASVSTQVSASGHIPPRALPSRDFDSFESCRAYLQQVHADDVNGTTDGDVPMENGGTRRKTLDTNGVVSTGADTVRYEATVGMATRGVEQQFGESYRCVPTHFSYTHTVLACSGAKLSGVQDSGFTLPGCDPVTGK
ncbi:hypothetical protein GQ57_20215 [Burkholderia sp. MSh2]|uniref:Uncharacterized protein n=1 Tax=Burkholderia paludis TaxID=1506587 RepID=A0A6P2KFQ2_9BURK|nr:MULTISPECIES: hypothetical protein [Burkholderia]KEZ04254.1 hypothetical protein GQ57_20215 [Burkholderia sp. MSh2]CAB3759117.1 hypothetical protein LMG30113_03370 [Burkholderia paludis]VWB53244.1 hypothetical protein BPA30113_02312 [Burkholderia paludis]